MADKKGGEERHDRRPCPACGGSGQCSTFKGVSRFLLTVEECPECVGLGFVFADDECRSAGQDDGV